MDVGDRQPFRLEEADTKRDEILGYLRGSPREHGIDRTRWRLQDLLAVVGASLGVTCVSGLWRVMQRLALRFRQGWAYAVSPDPLADEKLAWIDAIKQHADAHPDRVVVLWLDELTVYTSPSVAGTWGPAEGRAQKAVQATDAEDKLRMVGVLNHLTGQVHYWIRRKVGKQALVDFYAFLRSVYPNAEELYVIQDCCPTHFLDEVCHAAVQAEITQVPLPTYSSWRNPIEKLWRWLKQDVIHMHPWARQPDRLRTEICHFLDQFGQPNTRLLRYVGLSR